VNGVDAGNAIDVRRSNDDTAIRADTDVGVPPTVAGQVDVGVTDAEMDTAEDDGERFSTDSASSSSAEDRCRGRRVPTRGRTTACDDGGEEDGAKNRTTKNDNGCPAGADATTSPPPDVIMHHNNAVKRKGSRRNRRGGRSSTGAVVAAEEDRVTPAVREERRTSGTMTDLDVVSANRVDEDGCADAGNTDRPDGKDDDGDRSLTLLQVGWFGVFVFP